MSGAPPAHSAIAVGIFFPIIDGVLVALRFWTRAHQKVRFGLDDYLTLPAWACLTGCCISILIGEFKGLFADVAPTEPDDVTEAHRLQAQVTGAMFEFWVGANFFVKLAVLFFYRRVFLGRAFDIASKILITLSGIWFIYATLSWLLYCGANVKANFEGGWLACPAWGLDTQIGVYALDSFIDLCLLLLPMPLVWRLSMDRKRKIILTGVFLVGALAFGAGLVNTVVVWLLVLNPAFAADGGDVSFYQGVLNIVYLSPLRDPANVPKGSSLLYYNWLAIEVGVGLFACNIPTLSYHIIDRISQMLSHGFRSSWTGIRRAASTLRSGTGSQARTRVATRGHATRAMREASPETLHDSIETNRQQTKSKASKSSLNPSFVKGGQDPFNLEELAVPRGSEGAAVTIRGQREGYEA